MKFKLVVLYLGLSLDYSEIFYSEEDHGRPLLPASATIDMITGAYCKFTEMNWSFQNVTPRKGRELSQMELPLDYARCSPLTGPDSTVPRYLTALLDDGRVIYGWVDGFEPVAEKGPGNNTRVLWHVDWWMQYQHWKRSGTPYTRLTHGRIKRGPAADARPEPSEPRYWEYSYNYILNPNQGPYAVALFTRTVNNVTELRLQTWNIKAVNAISAKMIYDGLAEECMGIDPDSIQGIWFSPIQAFQMNIQDRRTNNFQSINWEWFEISAGDVNTVGNAYTFIYDATTVQKTVDYEKWILVDPMGTTYATLPWGIPWRYLYLTVDVGAAGAFLIVNALDNAIGTSSIGEGRTIKMPLISAPVTSNAFSSYVYSGQREYDIRMAEIQQNASAQNGIAGIGTQAMTGAMMGSIFPGVGTQIGAVGGMISGAISTAAGYYITGETDKKSQAATDKLMANQTSSVIIGAGGPEWLRNIMTNGSWRLVKMTADSVSMAALQDEQSELGYITDRYTDSLDSEISANGGPYRVEEVGMSGMMPNEGRRYLAALLQRGVKFSKYNRRMIKWQEGKFLIRAESAR